MARKKQAPAPENHERWLVSYADFITLLFAFFVVMFASSQTDKSRAKQVSQAVEKALQDGHSITKEGMVTTGRDSFVWGRPIGFSALGYQQPLFSRCRKS